MRRALLYLTILVLLAARSAGAQPALTITAATPHGALQTLADAGQVRVEFSEAMVAIGTAAAGAAPPWAHMTPSVPGSFYWSGTRTLIFSPAASTGLPYATAFTVTIDASAASIAGHTLAAPFTFTFTTPAVRLVGPSYLERTRFDEPAIVFLRFNQPVRPADVLAHTHVALEPHEWQPPEFSPRARAWLEGHDPGGLAAFAAKVAAVSRVAAASDPVEIRLAKTWTAGYEPAPELVVIETAIAPPPGAWLRVTLDDTLPSPAGPLTHPAQSEIVRLPPAFFAAKINCEPTCPSRFSPYVSFSAYVAHDEAIAHQRVVDVTDPAAERDVPIDTGTGGYAGPWGGAALPSPPPLRTWRVHVDPDVRAVDGQTLGYPWVGVFDTEHDRPALVRPGSVWEASGGPAVSFAARNLAGVTSSAARLNGSDIVPTLRMFDKRPPRIDTNPVAITLALDGLYRTSIDFSHYLTGNGTGFVWSELRGARGVPEEKPADPQTRLLELTQRVTPAVTAAGVLQVTNLGLTVKHSARSTLVFVTRLDSGDPVAGAQVSIFDEDNQRRWSGATAADGVAVTPPIVNRHEDGAHALSIVVVAEHDGDRAFVTSQWGPHQEFLPARTLRGGIFTDRGAYKPGEDVHFKAVVRDDTPDGVIPVPAGTRLRMTMYDDRSDARESRVVRITAASSAEWTWHVPERASFGTWRAVLQRISRNEDGEEVDDVESAVSGAFLVSAFRRPDFQVTVAWPSLPVFAGDTPAIDVAAQFLFGGALGARPVEWNLRRDPVTGGTDAIRQRFPFGRYVVGIRDFTDRGEFTRDEAVLSADGRFRVPLSLESAPTTQSYTFEADVEGPSGQHIANRAMAIVHPASLYVVLSQPAFFVTATHGIDTRVLTAALDGSTVPGVPVTVTLVRREWRQKPFLADRYPDGEWVEIPSGQWTIQSTAGEVPLHVPVPDSGAYVLRAEARDTNRHLTRTEAEFYAAGPSARLWPDDGQSIELTPERQAWKPSETARVLVRSPWAHAAALVTVERNGVLRHWTTRITSTLQTIDVPITEADVPNVHVAVVLVKGRTAETPTADRRDPGRPAYRLGEVNLTVDAASKRLDVTVEGARATYRPRAAATVSVVAKTPQGRPAADAEVTFWAVDSGLLALTGYTAPDLARKIYVEQDSGVTTDDTREWLIHRLPDGELDASDLDSLLPVETYAATSSVAETVAVTSDRSQEDHLIGAARRDFRPLAHWLGSAPTDATGRAAASFTFPDTLTSYRLIAVAATKDSRFGAGEREVTVAQPLALLPALPRFLTAGDSAHVGAVVANNTTHAGIAVVRIETLEPGSLRLFETRREVPLAPGASQAVTFAAEGLAVGTARVRITATLGAERDSVEAPLTITREMRTETTAAYGTTTGRAEERIALPADFVHGRGGLSVELASTALVGLGESARYLAQYPYECAEQKASRAIAFILAAQLGNAFHLPAAKPGQTRTAADRALRELYQFQCDDGGFSLWRGECNSRSVYLTAYVLHVLKVSQTLGVTLDQTAVDRALDYLASSASEKPPVNWSWPVWAASRAYAAKVVAEFGRDAKPLIAPLLDQSEHLPTTARSYVADALAAEGDKGPRYQDLIRLMTNALRVEADRAHVEDQYADALGWIWTSNVHATAVVLDGLLRRGDPGPHAGMARWLLDARRDGRWPTTHDNAIALEALSGYYRSLEPEVPHMRATVAIGATPLGLASFSGRSSAAQHLEMPLSRVVSAAADGASRLSIARTGTGTLYYTARVQTFAPQPPAAQDRGFGVERHYARYSKNGPDTPATTFEAGDVIRVTVTLTLRGEGRYLALTDPLPAGFEAIEAWNLTANQSLLEDASQPASFSWSGFDHVEQHDDRVRAFATRLESGRHTFSYLVRATTAGTFTAAGATVEAMYAPELTGRSAAATVTVK